MSFNKIERLGCVLHFSEFVFLILEKKERVVEKVE